MSAFTTKTAEQVSGIVTNDPKIVHQGSFKIKITFHREWTNHPEMCEDGAPVEFHEEDYTAVFPVIRTLKKNNFDEYDRLIPISVDKNALACYSFMALVSSCCGKTESSAYIKKAKLIQVNNLYKFLKD